MHSLETMRRLNQEAAAADLARAERDALHAENVRQYQARKRLEERLDAELIAEIDSIEDNETVA